MENKKTIIFLIITLSLLVIAILTFMVEMLFGGISFMNFKRMRKVNVSNSLVLDEIYENEFNHIEIESDASDIYIKETNDNKSKVIVYGDPKRTEVTTENNKLQIKSRAKKCVFFCVNVKASKIEIYLSKDYNNTIDIKNDYGDIEIGNFKESDIKIKESCGDIFISTAKNIDIVNDYGNVEINNGNIINVKESCGDVKIGTVNDLTVENKYGDIDIKNVNNYMDIKDDCGDIEIDNVSINKNSYIKNSLGNIEINSTNDIHINAKTSLGDTEVRNNYQSDTVLTIKNNCGDIEVNN